MRKSPALASGLHSSKRDVHKPRVHGKLQRAISRMVEDGDDYATAARKEAFTVAAMRKALNRPHVIAYAKQQRRAFRIALSTRNDLRLAEIRDQSQNMIAAVQAVRVLEGLREIDEARPTAEEQPGLVIVVQNYAPDAPATSNDVVRSEKRR